MITQYQAAMFGKIAYDLFENELLKILEEKVDKLKNVEEKEIKNNNLIFNQKPTYNYQEVRVSSGSSDSPKIHVNPKINASSPKIEKISKLNDDITKIIDYPNSNMEVTII